MNTLLSVGIDIGTTTTQLVLSRLTLENVMPGSCIPRMCITNKSVVYIGQVHFTPFIDRDHVDGRALRELVSGEYIRSGYTAADIDTGAVIITGETAKKENAAEILHSLAGFAGDFVVATAGPDLEGIIAGKGSGAFHLAKQQASRIVNIDIGGGTSNIVIFKGEKVQGTACLNIGGRLIEVDPLTQVVRYITQPAAKILKDLGDPLSIGDKVNAQRLLPFVRRMVELLDSILLGEEPDSLTQALLMTGPLNGELEYDGVVLSGGVGRYVYMPHAEWFIHGDIGVLLAMALRDARFLRYAKLQPAKETLHATVLGAGAHTLSVSGSTTYFDLENLPIRNLPVVPLDPLDSMQTWRQCRKRHSEERVAYGLAAMQETGFQSINKLALKFLELYHEFPQEPLILLATQDIGKALGQAVQAQTQTHAQSFQVEKKIPFICLDEVEVQEGDFIDLGKALPDQEAVPIILKTLIFGNN